MYKRIIAITAALSMVFGSALIPAADTGGEPVRQVTGKLNKTIKAELRNSKTEIRTTEWTYGPIRPVEVKEETNDTRRSESDVEPDAGRHEAEDNGDSTGGTSEELAPTVQLPEPAGDPEPSGDVLEGSAGADPEPEQAPEEEFGASGDDYEETGEDSGENVTPESVVEEPESEWSYYGNCRITHYCDCPECTGPWYGSATASGAWPSAFYTVASGEDLPFGTEVLINGQVYVVQDRGVGCGQIDIFVGDHQLAMDMGMYYTDVYVKW